MNWKIADLCADRILGSAARNQPIMFLADNASDDGSGIWYSKGTIQRHTELGESTVKRTITEFLREGILIETGRCPCKNGFTVIHRIVLDRVDGFGKLHRTRREDGVHSGPQTTMKPSLNHPRASARRRRCMNGLMVRARRRALALEDTMDLPVLARAGLLQVAEHGAG